MVDNQGQRGFGNSGASGGVAEKTRDAVSGVTGAVRDAAAGVADTAMGWASNMAETAQTVGSGVAHGAEGAYSATRDAIVGGEESVEEFIRRHPIPVVLGALLAGCLIGSAMSRK